MVLSDAKKGCFLGQSLQQSFAMLLEQNHPAVLVLIGDKLAIDRVVNKIKHCAKQDMLTCNVCLG